VRALFALPGFHRVARGAEVALESVAASLARDHGVDVTLVGSGGPRPGTPYTFVHAGALGREHFQRFARVPGLRHLYTWEDMTFTPMARMKVDPRDFDVTVTCSYPFSSWMLRSRGVRRGRTPHVFVTQNGDWPAQSQQRRYRLFSCDGLVCTNPIYFERNRSRWTSALIPNGVDATRFTPGSSRRAELGLPQDRPIVLIVSALIRSKRVPEAIRAVSRIPDAHVLVAGDGPEQAIVDELAAELLTGRFTRTTVPIERMPDLYRSADVLLHLSKDESFGNIYIEAAACGLPVIAHRTPTTEWILGDAPGLVDTESTDDVVGALHAAIDAGPADVTARASITGRFDWPVVAGQYRSFFEQVA
jgi:glycosyltransferase involved in cell wall biosynthesis